MFAQSLLVEALFLTRCVAAVCITLKVQHTKLVVTVVVAVKCTYCWLRAGLKDCSCPHGCGSRTNVMLGEWFVV